MHVYRWWRFRYTFCVFSLLRCFLDWEIKIYNGGVCVTSGFSDFLDFVNNQRWFLNTRIGKILIFFKEFFPPHQWLFDIPFTCCLKLWFPASNLFCFCCIEIGQRSKQAIQSWSYRRMCNKPLETKTDPPPPTTPAHGGFREKYCFLIMPFVSSSTFRVSNHSSSLFDLEVLWCKYVYTHMHVLFHLKDEDAHEAGSGVRIWDNSQALWNGYFSCINCFCWLFSVCFFMQCPVLVLDCLATDPQQWTRGFLFGLDGSNLQSRYQSLFRKWTHPV